MTRDERIENKFYEKSMQDFATNFPEQYKAMQENRQAKEIKAATLLLARRRQAFANQAKNIGN